MRWLTTSQGVLRIAELNSAVREPALARKLGRCGILRFVISVLEGRNDQSASPLPVLS